MFICARCECVVGDVGAFLPGASSDFVCLDCFRERCDHAPMPEGTTSTEQVNRHGVLHRPGRPGGLRRYSVVPINPALSSLRKKIAKKNLLASINMPPGSYYF